jgi:hypothetical protein
LNRRIPLGSEGLIMHKAKTWAAALDYVAREANLRPVEQYKVAESYGINDSAVRDRQRDLM